ncbi:MAG: hypothetical protein CL677_08895 [Bdellovibrionaceae bacterium]|nr:hypothetical protein [Pseudobdellovibrionaceae bacterium]|tara:strand:+ start:36466 stop:37644 length:1179 start_codon:yes stop_codon:yes gene_type:complete
MNLITHYFSYIITAVSILLPTGALANSNELIFYNLTGYDYPGDRLVLNALSPEEAVQKGIEDSEFMDAKINNLVSRMTREEDNPFEELGYYHAALALGMTTDIDFRDIFIKTYSLVNVGRSNALGSLEQIYRNGTEEFDLSEISMNGFSNISKKAKLRFEDDFIDSDTNHPDLANMAMGLFSTYEFAKEFLNDGTQRKAVRGVYDIFLCSKIDTYKDSTLDSFYVGADIDRDPGGNPHKFNGDCSGCHVPLDSQRPAFSYHAYNENNSLRFDRQLFVLTKLNRNPKEYGGTLIYSDFWENPLTTPTHQARFDWRGPTSGKGLQEWASMIVNSGQFSRCMAQKVLQVFCDKSEDFHQEPSAKVVVQDLANKFEDSGYRFLELIKSSVRSPICH